MTLKFTTARKLYVVHTDATNPRHHGLHTNTAPYLLTDAPGEGDRVFGVLDGALECEALDDGSYRVVEAWSERVLKVGAGTYDAKYYRLATHAGRSAMIGEDGLEDAFGGDALAELLPELARAGRGWTYAPIDLVEIDPAKDRGLLVRLIDDALWVRLIDDARTRTDAGVRIGGEP